ncbi:MAG TPA: exonuclease SbcCD subunit D [Anaerolineaceae bacterium]|jgi:exonuclease SbcD|nr:exonuclease SbcCD subunit D [Anaerolineaceae bacterium]HOS53493.1 exonuclease SbcCD subunit D [Anaerolineaceae bacterium]HPD63164.1 exonuclease SbcCD subunit D [Anaerolineaceae bacterium]HQF68992.1 exonuclease SbcCD subunit D [Anaerolineaceae bacterium]HQK05517.1 exonuclease SbcCD subunit D [Anaerolineaceae bacterium]
MIKILHFADAHIDIATHGKHDPETGLPIRALDFLKALDTIIDHAISEKVDLVIFAGDAYKDRTPSPTFQREWGKRIIRLPQADIPALLLVGNHDISPASGRAHTLQEFDTLQVPKVRVLYKPELLKPADLWGLQLQVLSLPWVFRSSLVAALGLSAVEEDTVHEEIEKRLTTILQARMDELDPALPTVLVGHGSVQGAVYGNERTVMLGKDLVLPGSLVKDPRLDYTALGHIHKYQDLNPGLHPPVVYAGSIERVDFGEVADDKGFVIAEVEKGNTSYRFVKLHGRAFFDRLVRLSMEDRAMEKILASSPNEAEAENAIFRLVIEYPRELEADIDEPALRQKFASALEFHLVRRPQAEARLRLPADQNIASYSPLELLSTYWKSTHAQPRDLAGLQTLAQSIFQSVTGSKPG